MFDNSFSKLYRDRYKARLSATLQRMRLDPSAQNIIVQALDRAAEELQLPGVLLDANPWVSPRRQASLLKWMRQKLRDQKNIEDLMPPHPAAADSYGRLENLFRRCQRELEGRKDKSFYYFANLAFSWMNGKTIPEMILDIERYKTEKNEEYHLPTLIRAVLGNIEKDLRFRMVKLTSCYNAVLKLVLNEIGQPDLIEHVAAIPLYLEMGASSVTMLSFMEMGLSRITGRLLQDQAADSFMGVSAAQQWLRRRSLSIDRLPAACRREVSALIAGVA